MKLDLIPRRLAGAVLTTSLLALSLPAPALAQPVSRAELTLAQPVAGDLQIPCCRCLDGQAVGKPIPIHTRPVVWQVAAPGSGTFAPASAASNVAWTPVPPGQWIGPAGNAAIGDYTFQLPFKVPNCVIPSQITISGKFAADNSAKLYVDGTLVKTSQGTPNYGFLPGSVTPFTYSGTLAPGPHTIRVVVTNTSGPTGLVVAGDITVTCPKDLLRRD